DVALLFGVIAKRFSNLVNGEGEIAVFDKRAGHNSSTRLSFSTRSPWRSTRCRSNSNSFGVNRTGTPSRSNRCRRISSTKGPKTYRKLSVDDMTPVKVDRAVHGDSARFRASCRPGVSGSSHGGGPPGGVERR